jgi:hypothetical protein
VDTFKNLDPSVKRVIQQDNTMQLKKDDLQGDEPMKELLHPDSSMNDWKPRRVASDESQRNKRPLFTRTTTGPV